MGIFYGMIAVISVVFLIMFFLSKKRKRISPSEMADIIERFIDGKSSEWEWDEFISLPINDPTLDKIRVACLQLDKEYPPIKPGMYTNENGLEILRQYVEQLRTKHNSKN